MHQKNNGYSEKIVKPEDLQKAMEHRFNGESKCENPIDLTEEAERISNFFGFQGKTLDNILEEDDRAVFYMLQDMDLIRTESEDVTLYDGRPWRIQQWVYNKEEIFKAVDNYEEKEDMEKDPYSVYDDIPSGVWK